MNKFFIIIVSSIVSMPFGSACTGFVMTCNNSYVFGKNLDWMSEIGMIIINPRNTQKESFVMPPEKSVLWKSQYGSLTFNQFGQEFPFGGINEQGLIIEVMIGDATYPVPDQRPMVNELQWVQYQLDNCATISDVIASEEKIRIGQTHEELHYLIADKFNHVAVVEFVNGQQKVYTNNDLPIPVLTNDPYPVSLQNLKDNHECRFTTAAQMIQQFEKNPSSNGVDYAFDILEETSFATVWSIVYDVSTQKIFFKTESNQETRELDLTVMSFDSQTPEMYHLRKEDGANISYSFEILTAELNSNLFNEALEDNGLELEPSELNQLQKYQLDLKYAYK